MNNKLQPAIIGGVVLGLLSAIPFLNACCCLWALVGGALASYLYIKRSTVPVTVGEGALLGGIAGIVGSIIFIILGSLLSVIIGNQFIGPLLDFAQGIDPAFADQLRQQIETAQNQTFLQRFVRQALESTLLGVLMTVLAIIGGLLAVPLFEKRKGNTDLPPVAQPGSSGSGYGNPGF